MEETAWRAVRDVLVALYDGTNRSLDAHGRAAGAARIQVMAMDRVESRPGITQTELARTLSTTKQYIGRVVRHLEERGLMEARPSALDGRAQGLYLTPAGRDAQDAWRAAHIQGLRESRAGLSEEGRARFWGAVFTLRDLAFRLTEQDKTLF